MDDENFLARVEEDAGGKDKPVVVLLREPGVQLVRESRGKIGECWFYRSYGFRWRF